MSGGGHVSAWTRRRVRSPGVLHGLERIGDTTNDERLLSWAPDFAGEAGASVLGALADIGLELTGAECSGDSIIRG